MEHPKMPQVSICVTTFNQEKYIEECLNSILIQEVSFNYEIIVADDMSSDRTRAILISFEEKYPGIFKLLFNEHNLGMTLNIIRTVEAAKGNYVAIMDGDDVWVDVKKLQRQFEFLEKNREYSLVFHDALICNSELLPLKLFSEKYKNRTQSFEISKIVYYQGVLGATSSIFFRKSFDKFDPLYYEIEGCVEKLFFFFLRQFGEFKYFTNCCSYYRTHSKGYMKSVHKIAFRNNLLATNRILLKSFPDFNYFFTRKIILNRILLMTYFIQSMEIKSVLIHIIKIPTDIVECFLINLQKYSKSK